MISTVDARRVKAGEGLVKGLRPDPSPSFVSGPATLGPPVKGVKGLSRIPFICAHAHAHTRAALCRGEPFTLFTVARSTPLVVCLPDGPPWAGNARRAGFAARSRKATTPIPTSSDDLVVGVRTPTDRIRERLAEAACFPVESYPDGGLPPRSLDTYSSRKSRNNRPSGHGFSPAIPEGYERANRGLREPLDSGRGGTDLTPEPKLLDTGPIALTTAIESMCSSARPELGRPSYSSARDPRLSDLGSRATLPTSGDRSLVSTHARSWLNARRGSEGPSAVGSERSNLGRPVPSFPGRPRSRAFTREDRS